MIRIKLDDLPILEELTHEEMAEIVGGTSRTDNGGDDLSSSLDPYRQPEQPF